jgi:hypothetical protein
MITGVQLKKLHEQVTQRVLSSQDDSRGSRQEPGTKPQLRVEDKAYLSTQKRSSQRIPRILDNDQTKPFLEVDLGFHASLSEPADLKTALLTTNQPQAKEEDEFEVEDILERRGQRYLIKWKGYPHSENTWEPIHNLGNCQMILRQFRRTAASRCRRTAESSRNIP